MGSGRLASLVRTLLTLGALVAGCAPAPKPALPAAPSPITLDQKVSWLLRLEQERVLRDPSIEVPAPQGASAERVLAPARSPDLTELLQDTDPNVRRRAALAIGRVASPAGVAPLVASLDDADEQVRAAAAFGLGLIGARAEAADAPLETLLNDPSPLVRGRAAEGLGLIGSASAAAPIAAAFGGCAAPLASIGPDDESAAQAPDARACELALFALVRLKQYDALARVALDTDGQPIARWWPVAYALDRIADKRAIPALRSLVSTDGIDTVAFALHGLAAAGDRQSVPLALTLAARTSAPVRLRVAAIQFLAQVGGTDAVEPLMQIAFDPATPPNVAIEAVMALGPLGDARAYDALLDQLTSTWPAMRSAALTSAAKIDPDGFLLVAAGLRNDSDWSVRASLASVLATLPADRVRPALGDLVDDHDARVRAAALRALAMVGAPDLGARLFAALQADDFVVRETAADLIGDHRPAGGAERLAAAYDRGQSDSAYAARLSALEALAKYGADAATPVLHRGLSDKAWPVRWRAAELLRTLGEPEAAPELPAPTHDPPAFFASAALLHPEYSPHAFIETAHGTIEIELDVVNAPLTTHTFVELARSGFFNGMNVHRVVPDFVVQAGDPRGDGEGGPGFTIRDELSAVSYVRGTVGMALDPSSRDTGGSQFFITLSPQPRLDAKYTAFGRVVRGADLLDAITQGDVIERVRIWDGVTFQ